VTSLESFIDALISWIGPNDPPELFGRIFLTNLWFCCEQELVDKQKVADFLTACAKEWEAERTADPTAEPNLHDLIENVCRGASSGGARHFLRSNRQHAAPPPHRTFTTVVSFETFSVYHVDKSSRVLRGPLTASRPKISDADLNKCRRELSLLTETTSWVKPGATLGNPSIPDNCWVSIAAGNLEPADQSADEARDGLGLIHREVDDHLVALEFESDAAAQVAGFEMARPMFADLGNSRFCAMHSSAFGRDMASLGWGCTVDLKRFAQKVWPPTGRPERVTSVLPLAELGPVRVRYLGAIKQPRGKGSEDDDKAFLEHLLDVRSIDDIKTSILGYI
jgi:hypothetical protein